MGEVSYKEDGVLLGSLILLTSVMSLLSFN